MELNNTKKYSFYDSLHKADTYVFVFIHSDTLILVSIVFTVSVIVEIYSSFHPGVWTGSCNLIAEAVKGTTDCYPVWDHR